MHRLSLCALALGLLAPRAASAEFASYQVIGISPTPAGARLEIAFFNELCQSNQGDVGFFVYDFEPSGGTNPSRENKTTGDSRVGDFCVRGGKKVGNLRWAGRATTIVDLDYATLGLTPNTPLYTSANFFSSNGSWGHAWGDPWVTISRSARGPVTLPPPRARAARNAAFAGRGRRASCAWRWQPAARPLAPRWRPGR